VEDNAQGIGARGDGFKIGELSDTVCTSFIIQKNLGCFGDGGAVVTNHENVDREIRKLRNHGSDKRSCHSMGYNSRLDDLQAGVLSAKLQAHRRMERPAPEVGRALLRRPARRRQHPTSVRSTR
jgi:UDP-2-acetamido-2-deoxy-ribo-hexuluronate aminotransferase